MVTDSRAADDHPRLPGAPVQTDVPPTQPGPAGGRTLPEPPGRRSRRPGPETAGTVLVLLSVLPVLLAVAWVVAAFPLAATGHFHPYTVIPAALVAAAVIVPLGLAAVRPAAAALRTPWWPVLATVAVAGAFAVFAALTHDQQIILRRDAGSYAQIGYLLAHHGGLIFRTPAAAFGPSPGHLSYSSLAFYQRGDLVVPQFMTGWPTVIAAADWMAGWYGVFALPALVAGAAVLAFGGLAARLVGPRWAPLAALLLGFAWPLLRVSQTTYSEPLALLVLVGGLCLVTDVVMAGTRHGGPATLTADTTRRVRRLAFAAGLVLGSGELVRVDFAVDVALLLPVVAWLWLTRRPGAYPFLAGAVLGGGLGAADGAFVTWPYIELNRSSVVLMAIFVVAAFVASAVAAVLLRWYGRPLLDLAWWRRAVPVLGALAVLLLAAALVARPYLQVDHSTTDQGVQGATMIFQHNLGLPLDGTRGYTEQSLWWVSWYLGWPLLAAALVGAAALTWRVLRGRDPWWMPALLVYLGATALTLIRPGVTPDHPWADRRLVVEVIPATVLFATWLTAAAVRATGPLAARWAGAGTALRRLLPAAVGVALVGAFVVPMSAATVPLAPLRTELGEVAGTAKICAALRPDDSVVLIGSQWVPTVREQCNMPVAELLDPTPAAVAGVIASVRAAGRTPVLAGDNQASLRAQGLQPTNVLTLVVQQDQNQLIQRPTGTQTLRFEFWMVRP